MPGELIRLKGLLDSLMSEDNKNPYILSFERTLKELITDLEEKERSLSALSGSLDEEKEIYNKIKEGAPELKSLLKPLAIPKYAELLMEIGYDINFEEIGVGFDTSLAAFMEDKRASMASKKEQIESLQNQITGLTSQVEEVQKKLNAQKKLRDNLIDLKAKAKEVTIGTVVGELEKSMDENNNPLFDTDELDAVANMIMFPKMFEYPKSDGISVGTIIRSASEAKDNNGTDFAKEVAEAVIQVPLEPLKMPEAIAIEKKSDIYPESEQGQISYSNTAAIADRFGPWKNGEEAFPDIDDLLAEVDLDESLVVDATETAEDEIKEPSVEESLNPYDLIEEPAKEEPKVDARSETKNDRYKENLKYLFMLGLSGDYEKHFPTLSEVTVDEIKKAIENVGKYGYKPRNIGEIAKILSTNNAELARAFEQAIKAYAEEYSQYIKTATIFKILGAYKPIIGEIIYAVGELFPAVIEELSVVSDNVYNPYGSTIVMGLMDKLEKALESDGYSFYIGDKAIPKSAVLDLLEKATSSDKIMGELSDEELMLIALTYDPKFSALDVESIKEELHDKLGDARGMKSAA